MTAELDPFDTPDKAPALSFKDAPPGTSHTLTVTDPPKLVQSRDFKTNEPAVWDDGNPKYSAVINGVTTDGEPRSLWASKPSALFAAIADAQKTAGAKITAGGTLVVTYTHSVPNKSNPALDPAKQYSVTYTAPDVFSAAAAVSVQSSVDRYPGASEALAARLANDNVTPEAAAAIINLDGAVRVSLGYPA